MTFQVICLETTLPATSDEGEARLFDTGREAAAFAQSLTVTTGKKHQPRPVIDAGWKERESERFRDGTYSHVPWEHCHWVDPSLHHYPHASLKIPGRLAFTESGAKGAADIQTPIKPGVYLQRFYPDLSQGDVTYWAEQFNALHAPCTIRWATTADEIEDVYTNGPTSCMAHGADHFDSPGHPVRVYATGGKDGESDLSVAYLVRGDDEDAITARVLVWQARKRYSSIYGDEARLQAQLEREGYTHGLLDGARMRRVRSGDGFVVPYVDQSHKATDNGGWLIIDRDGAINCACTNGLSCAVHTCDYCGEECDEDELSHIDDVEESWCQSCCDSHTFYCDCTGRTCTGDFVSMSNGETWSQAAFERYGLTCEATGACCTLDDTVTLSDGTVWASDHFTTHGHQCDKCGECFASGDTCGQEDCELDLDETGGTAGHQARQVRSTPLGRDEAVDQIEMPLLPPMAA